ncbi:MAG: alpha/beta fold hydrolase [Bacteroidota bacterium]
MIKLHLLSALILLTIISCSESKTQSHFSDKITLGDCPSSISGYNGRVACGYLEVPENREKNNGKVIQLAFARIKSEKSNPKKDPVVYLMGGPGGGALQIGRFWVSHPLTKERDLILLDQRGTGYSKPALCANFTDDVLAIIAKDIKAEEEYPLIQQAAEACRKGLLADDVDLGAFNSIQNAADLDDLRKALGYETWNLFGGSYGTRLALTAMRYHPEGIRSVILSGSFPPNVNMYDGLIPNFRRSLGVVFDACAADPYCNSKYPDLSTHFFEAIASLDKDPVSITYNGDEYVINAQDALLIAHQFLYDRTTISRFPEFAYALKERNIDIIRNAFIIMATRAGAINFGMYFSVQAYEELPFHKEDSYQNTLEAIPELKPGIAFFNSELQVLKGWHKERAEPIENQAVESDIPTLIMAGEYDPITPPSNGRLTQQGLSNSHFYEFAGRSHTLFGDCSNDLMIAFLNNPSKKLLAGCVERSEGISFR